MCIHLYILLYFLSTISWSYNFSYIVHGHNFSTLSYLSFQGMPPARVRRPPKRLGAESVETLHNPDVTDVSVPEHEETSTLSSSKAKRLTMTDVSKTVASTTATIGNAATNTRLYQFSTTV